MLEVDQVLGQNPPTIENIGRLDYLDQVVKETLRLYPPIHVGNRLAAEDMCLGGYYIPAKTRVMYSIYLSHRDPAYWTEPADFRPERFDSLQRDFRPPPFTYVPFGGGPRNCIGAAFAQVEAKVVLAKVLQRFELHSQPGKVTPHMGATLEPRPGVFMCVQRR
jgi:cytochrome P450